MLHSPAPFNFRPENFPVVADLPRETIAALATPAGSSALAIIRVSGPACRVLASAIFDRAYQQLPERRPIYATYRSACGQTLDDLVWTFLPGPRTATGEDTLELSPHGNPLIAQLILEDLFKRGCRPAEPGEFTRRAFLSGKIDLTQAEAVMDLIHARSERALAVAQRQLRGGLGRLVEGLIADLLLALARVEVYIDFPDEDLPTEDRQKVLAALQKVLRGTKQLLATERFGGLLRDGVKAVLFGAPNTGKSSLLNALVGRERALVGPEPGTTRDYLEERLQVGPNLLRLVDTAGLNPSPGAVERQGMAKTLDCLMEADLVLWVMDATQLSVELDPVYAVHLNPGKVIVVLNKADLVTDKAISLPGLPHPTLSVSALTGLGLSELGSEITRIIDRLAPGVLGDAEVAVNARHAEALRRAEVDLALAVNALSTLGSSPVELISSDLRSTLEAFGEIAGRVDHERMLDELFTNFCIGK
jgi:tRNA modification GTPase